jgi:hypothetical protein
MIDQEQLFEHVDPEFEESIRIDREMESADPIERQNELYTRYLDRYYLTKASVSFLEDLFAHVHDPNPAPDERNHWLYGYYGSGKSHLLTALDLLLTTQDLERTDMDMVWARFDRQNEHPELGHAWHALHDDVLVVPLSINLLKYQGVREQSFSEIILQKVYQKRGFADRLDVAFFEEEFQREGGLYDTRDVWGNREQLLNEILRGEGVDEPDYNWDDVRQYRILSDIVLEGLTEEATGMTENLADIQNRNVGQELAVDAIEAYRQELQEEFDRTVKIVLLMDEVTLFIGGNYQRLSELNALAESIKDVGQGNIISVVTAQSNIEDVQPGLAVKQLDFGILKDRFPQQYELPSRHVGEIVQRRLLTKSASGRQWTEDDALSGSVHPQTMLVYREVTQNTEPPLDEIDDERFIQYYPLLPYQPALFMEILSNLRDELADATKSIFSGTARAILSLVAGLREEWSEKDGEKPIISLVDFYNLVEYELEDIIPEKTTVIQDIADDPATSEFDVKVAKAVLLLSYVPDMVPQNDANLATAVMGDLEGNPRANVQNQVRESLEDNLEKYIRPDTSTDGSDLRLTDREEQQLISAAREFEANPDWDRVVEDLDQRLWEDIIAGLDLPGSHEYTSDGETAYPVGYRYEIDGQELEVEPRDDAVFDVDIVVRGLRPDADNDHIAEETLYWLIETEGIEELRSQLEEWWALIEATRSTNPPESLVRDRDDAADRVVEKLTAALADGSYQVEATEFTSFEPALADYIDEAYPSYFHPELSRIDESHLDELRQLEDGDELPEWAHTIGVPEQSTNDFATFSDIAFKLRQLVATEVQEGDPGLDVATILDRVCDQESLFVAEAESGVEPSPATLAVLWGLSRAGVFQLTSVDGEPVPVDKLLSNTLHTSLTLTPIPPGKRPKDVFVEHGIIEPTESGNAGYVAYNESLETIEGRASSLAEEIRVQMETTFETHSVKTLVGNLATSVEEIAENAVNRQEKAVSDDVERLREMVKASKQDEAALDEAQTRWEERQPFLLQLEGILRLGAADVEWLGRETSEATESLSSQLESVEATRWWTDDGWSTFVNALDARQTVVQSLRSDWQEQQTVTELEQLQTNLEGHPWLVQLNDLPTHAVHDHFRMEYLDTLRGFQTTLERIEMVLDPLTNPAPGDADGRALLQALGLLDRGLDWSAVEESTVAQRSDQLSTLDTVVGDATHEDLVGIGVLPGDAEDLQSQVEALDTDDRDPELIELDNGVVIQ